MNAPDKIYLPWEYSEIDVLPPGVTTKQVFGKDICFIRKDALLEWAEDVKAKTGWYEIEVAMDDLIDKLNSM